MIPILESHTGLSIHFPPSCKTRKLCEGLETSRLGRYLRRKIILQKPTLLQRLLEAT